jgi:hypothetical protein
MIEFESITYEEGAGPNACRTRTITKIHISPWVLKVALGGLGVILLGLAWVALGIYAS